MRRSFIAKATLGLGMTLLAACSGNSSALPVNSFNPAASQALSAFAPDAGTTDPVVNGTFSTGKLSPWVSIGTGAGAPVVDKGGEGTSKYYAFLGTAKAPAINGYHGIAQTITIPKSGVLTFYHKGFDTDEPKYGWQIAGLFASTSAIEAKSPVALLTCFGGAGSTKLDVKSTTWTKTTCNLSKYAGKKEVLFFGVDDDGYAKSYVNWDISNVSISG
jgi:hypothetical protein